VRFTSATSAVASCGVDETLNGVVLFDDCAEAVWPPGSGPGGGQLCGTTGGGGWRHGRSTAAPESGKAAAAARSAQATPSLSLLS
jgi:hypothetical protein